MIENIKNWLLYFYEVTGETSAPPAAEGDSGDMANTPPAAEEGTGQPEKPSFEDLINGDYKEDFQRIFNRRFKRAKEQEAALNALNPVIKIMAQKHGIDAEDMSKFDYAAFAKAALDDDDLYTDEALKAGSSVEEIKSRKQLEYELASIKEREAQEEAEREEARQQEAFDRNMNEVLAAYPGFDLRAELQNPAFGRLTADGMMSFKSAFELLHSRDLAAYAVAKTAQQAKANLSRSIASNASRPVEGGASGTAPSSMKVDLNNLSQSQYEDLKRRAQRGERITFK